MLCLYLVILPTLHTWRILRFSKRMLHSLLDIISPLSIHPHKRTRRDHRRPRQPSTPPRTPKHQPLTHKMPPRNAIAPERQLIDLGICDIIRSVQANDAGEQCPGAEGACGERCHWAERCGGCRCFGGSGTAVHFAGGSEGDVGLDAVEDRDEGDLSSMLACWCGGRSDKNARRAATWARAHHPEEGTAE